MNIVPLLLISLTSVGEAQQNNGGGLLGSILGNVQNGNWGNFGQGGGGPPGGGGWWGGQGGNNWEGRGPGRDNWGGRGGGGGDGPWNNRQGGGRGNNWVPNGGDNGEIPPPRPPPNAGDLTGSILGMVGDISNGLNNRGFDVLGDFRHHRGGRPSDWRRRARRFCRRFPGHPKCSGGAMPEFGDVQYILTTVLRETGKYLPRVPMINIRDPLAGVSAELSQIARGFNLNFGNIDKQWGESIKNVCRNFKCQDQNPQTEQLKKTVLTKVYDFEKAQLGKDTSDSINLRMDRTLQIKQALLEKANLTNVVTAADDGVFDKDLLLTERQQHFLLNELGKGGVGSDARPPSPGDERIKRASIFFEENLVQKWDTKTPIPYTFDESLEEYDKNDVRGAIAELEKKTCVRFQFVPKPTGYHINYQKVDSPTFCGLSYIGRVDPANPVYLSFQCGNARGVALHETMHALGVNHQHLRMDRDQHITVDWSNINPQHYDYFVVADSKLYTTYGVKYDYGSIMHYNAYTGAVNVAKPTMIPKVDQANNIGKLGQRDAMSAADVEIVKKMYCMPGCDDKNVYCGAWALKDLCNNPSHKGWMVVNCRKSCNFCTTTG